MAKIQALFDAKAHTVAVHGGEDRPHAYHALTAPIVQTATYTFSDTHALRAYVDKRQVRDKYGRYGNPTQRVVEQKLAQLEGGQDALLFPSGMAAVAGALWALLSAGDHVAVGAECYKQTRQFTETVLTRFGVEVSSFSPSDLASLEGALRPNTKLVFVETPSNPFLAVTDLEQLLDLTRPRGIRVVVDSTFATPINQRPLTFGADLVVHSATKYLSGHNDLLAGVVVGSAKGLEPIRKLQAIQGNTVDPHNAYLLGRGLKTLPLRIERQNRSALHVARFLEEHPNVLRVYYPGLSNHPSHAVAQRQMQGFGGVVSFDVKGDNESTARFIDALQVPLIASSFGGVDSLVEQTWLISYADLNTAARTSLGIGDNLVRYSVGIEDPDDLVADLDQALAVLASAKVSGRASISPKRTLS